jgi:hypothetical protein
MAFQRVSCPRRDVVVAYWSHPGAGGRRTASSRRVLWAHRPVLLRKRVRLAAKHASIGTQVSYPVPWLHVDGARSSPAHRRAVVKARSNAGRRGDVCRRPRVQLPGSDLANALDGPPIPGLTIRVAGRRLFAVRSVCLPLWRLGVGPPSCVSDSKRKVRHAGISVSAAYPRAR